MKSYGIKSARGLLEKRNGCWSSTAMNELTIFGLCQLSLVTKRC